MRAPDFEREGRDWPNREASRFVSASGIEFHVQIAGSGPDLLMLHGTGAATHSWRDLLPLLTQHFRVVAPDLPGHGFTDKPASHRLSLEGMATDLTKLLSVLETRPRMAVGHSAGAAILAKMCLDYGLDLTSLVSLNGAMLPLRGMAGQTFAPLAKLLAINPIVPQLVAWQAGDTRSVSRLVGGTGSRLDERGVEFYRRLTSSPRHAGAALAMMANWQLEPLRRNLHRLQPHLLLISASLDRAVPPDNARRIERLAPNANVIEIEGLGHLAHEEDPSRIAAIIVEEAIGQGLSVRISDHMTTMQ